MSKSKKEFTLSHKQAAAWEYLMNPKYAPITDIGYGGAAGGGKSILGCAWLITMARKYPNTRYAAATYDITKSIGSIGVSMRETLKLLGLVEDIDYTYNIKRHTYTFIKTGSEIVLFGLAYKAGDEQSAWLGGYLFTCSWVDESDRVDSRVIEVFKTRNGRYNNSVFIKYTDMTDEEKADNPTAEIDGGYSKNIIPKKVLQTFNPSQNHVYTTFWLPYKDRRQTTSRFIRATVRDNKYMDSSYISSLKNINDEVLRSRLYEGSFEYNTSDGALFDAESVAWMVENKVLIAGEKVIVVDVSGSGKDNDKTIISYWEGLDCYEIEQFTHEYSDELIDKLYNECLARGIPIKNLIIDGNGIGNEVARSRKLEGCISFMAQHSPIKEESGLLNVFKKNRNKISKKMVAQYQSLKDQCIWELSYNVNARLISASFDNEGLKNELRQELLVIEDETLGTDAKRRATPKKKIKNKIGRSPDVSDVFLMRMYLELLNGGVKKAIPLSQRKFIKKKVKRNNYE